MKQKHLKNLIFAAVFAALIFVATAVFPFPLPGGGYANLGDTFILVSAFFVGPLWGFFAGAIGSALADIALGFAFYAPATFVIKGLMAVAFALICRGQFEKKLTRRLPIVLLASIAAEAVMVGGYFLFECFVYGAFTAGADVVGNLVQAAVGVTAATVAITALSENKGVLRLSFGTR